MTNVYLAPASIYPSYNSHHITTVTHASPDYKLLQQFLFEACINI